MSGVTEGGWTHHNHCRGGLVVFDALTYTFLIFPLQYFLPKKGGILLFLINTLFSYMAIRIDALGDAA